MKKKMSCNVDVSKVEFKGKSEVIQLLTTTTKNS